MSTNDIERANNYYNNIIPDAEFLHTCTTYYNCHSYAWYNRDFNSNRYWIEDPSIFIDDNTYFEVDTPSMGDKLLKKCGYVYEAAEKVALCE